MLSALEWYWRPYSRMMVFERVYVRARMCMTLFVTPTDAVGSATVRGTIAEHRNRRHGSIRPRVYKTGFLGTRLDAPLSPTFGPNLGPSVLGVAGTSGAEPKRFGVVLGVFSKAVGPDARTPPHLGPGWCTENTCPQLILLF